MNKKKWIFLIGILVCIPIIGYSFMGCTIKYANKDKIDCKLNTKNAVEFNYKGETYEILDSSLEKSELSGWIGNVLKFVVLDENYCILEQKSLSTSLEDIAKNVSKDAKFIVSFQNVYSIKGKKESEAIAVHINGKFYKAVLKENKSSNDRLIKYENENRLDTSIDKLS